MKISCCVLQVLIFACVIFQASNMLFELLNSADNALLIAAVFALQKLFSAALANRVLVANYREVEDKIDLLTIHPYADIGAAAVELERLLGRYIQAAHGVGGEEED